MNSCLKVSLIPKQDYDQLKSGVDSIAELSTHSDCHIIVGEWDTAHSLMNIYRAPLLIFRSSVSLAENALFIYFRIL